ncbi:MAG TPA: TldD/PmbA family protein, partial [Candidatus Bathyarchaeota archaeon]|nr:TldD/PmbA family protein [Candidatus Bathyarchaeota archaeon]
MFSLQGFDYDTLSQRILGKARELSASYCDLRFNWSAATVIRVRNGEVETCNRGFSSGLGVRVIKDGAWGFASSGNVSKRDALNLVEEACKIASNTKGKDVKLAPVKIYEDRVSTPLRIDPNDISLESKVKTVLEAEEAARKYHPSIASTTASYIDISTHQYFASSEGAKIDSEITRVFTTLYVAAKEGSVISPSYEAIGGTRGYELIEKNPPEGLVKEVCERAMRLLKASPPPPGEYTAVMDPKILGLMIHEAFGHTAEA